MLAVFRVTLATNSNDDSKELTEEYTFAVFQSISFGATHVVVGEIGKCNFIVLVFFLERMILLVVGVSLSQILGTRAKRVFEKTKKEGSRLP